MRARVIAIALVVITAPGCVPPWVVRSIAANNPGCLYNVRRADKTIALTIDDGPDPATTPELLRLLAKHNARATFFLISNNVRGNSSLVTRMVREGHEIGNHFTRNEASIGLSPREFDRSFLGADSVLRRYARVRWVRPGSGHYNQRMLRTFRQHRYRCALGSIYPFDPQIPVPAFSAWVVRRNVRPGAVIILHDGGYRGRNTAKTLRRILPELKKRGYRVVTLSELTARRAPARRQAITFTE